MVGKEQGKSRMTRPEGTIVTDAMCREPTHLNAWQITVRQGNKLKTNKLKANKLKANKLKGSKNEGLDAPTWPGDGNIEPSGVSHKAQLAFSVAPHGGHHNHISFPALHKM